MTAEEAICYINSVGKKARRNSLGAIAAMCDAMGNVQDKLSVIHVAGTNGKGSVVAMLSSVLKEAGYRVGRFTSPYIEVFNDRIAIDGEWISDEDLAYYTAKLIPITEHLKSEGNEPSWFAFLTAIAFWYFYDKKCDFVVLETGIGGLYDSTNIIKKPVLSVITPIGYDHMKELGDTLLAIAKQKCGIIKENVPLVSSMQEAEVLTLMKEICAKKHCDFYLPKAAENVKATRDGNEFELSSYVESFQTGLVGEYQVSNALEVICAVEVLQKSGIVISDEALYQGLKNAVWIGRFQTISQEPRIVIDGAHNLSGMSACCESLDDLYAGFRKIVVLGMVGDKNYQPCLERLSHTADVVITTQISNPRSLKYHEIFLVMKEYSENVIEAKNVKEALKKACELCNDEKSMICGCGSLFLVADIIDLSKKMK